MNALSELVKNPQTYVESVGKFDKQNVREAIADGGEDTVLRMCIGIPMPDEKLPGRRLPLRVLGYYGAALAIQEQYFPKSQLQFVYPVKTSVEVNGVDEYIARNIASDTTKLATRLFLRRFSQLSPEPGDVESFYDSELPSADLQQAVADVLESNPSESIARLNTSAKARGANMAAYVAAHVLMHDTDPVLTPMFPNPSQLSDQKKANRLISIGAQSERPFYAARMACRRAGVMPAGTEVATGQIFTKHVIPPYQFCREGEPDISGVYASYEPFFSANLNHPVPSVARDLAFAHRSITDESKRFMELTTTVEKHIGYTMSTKRIFA